ncbi:hypothetical protein FCG67_03780 [Rhodococcus oryzae]|uniref:Secreted protein n=1 Tax=Rhodococcus oryzae TaxID=2571143 RepID=A0ABY2RNH0_9NOCA|nr:hypothetical protein [Rhodococcus oryzae]TJZ80021.1 hypothetical protein FCG67_03780 [Rhodococcus oryzae]
MKTARLVTALFASVILLAGCGQSDSPTPADLSTVSSASPTVTEPEASDPEPPLVVEPVPALVESEQVLTEPNHSVVEEEPYIVDCQAGMGPIITYWSDGTTTGYSDYCQSAHDKAGRDEAAANTPTCDGVKCTYPNGATMPDPNAAPPIPDDRCTNQINYAGDPRSNAEINSIGAATGRCPDPIT